ncbi:MAG TPA: PAS domain S-box protein, partial [Acidimicrobiales bacterium]|nr:PAS domain S-box protein [Acidimicrobiales bacterium]
QIARDIIGDREAQTHVRTIAGVLPIVVWALDEALDFTMVFGGGQRRLNLKDDELVGAPVSVFGELGVEVVRQVIASGEPQAFMATGDLDGQEWQYWNLVTPIEGTDRVVAISLDTTDQHLAARRAQESFLLNRTVAEALRDSEERFRLLATEAPIGIFVLGADGSLLYANPQVREQTGRQLAELVEQADAVVHPDDRSRFRAAMRRLFDERDPMIGDFRSLRPDGTVCWMRMRVSPLLDENGEPAGAVGSSADITDFRDAEQQVQEREERLRAIVETAAEGIVSTDHRGVIVEFNAAAERIFGCDSDRVIGQLRFTDLLAPELREQMASDFARYLDGAPPTLVGTGAREMPGVRADGTPVPLEIAVTEVMTQEGRLFTAVLRDISERLEFERRLEHLATHDPTTGLANRVFFTAQVVDALARSGRSDR